ncbi:hypothetical protein NIES37_28700 [Tolypothrix tenuis PCC 7101]|uniref:Uncharacterized protein n=1 Tax=Tolypothrix tenuis PCC 7101 TaxID=231146 RepID=A0A1Z4MZI6_9CYAN|nr:hypothetical protein NIES37_28700 [Tolypothrix tenuis PCC 7101]BAZ77189.1 hypothetical protein NIES50_57920 [Aulosira laxa NIES-50]
MQNIVGARQCPLVSTSAKSYIRRVLYKNSRPHPLTPSPPGEGELNLLLPSPGGRGVGGEGKTLQPSGFHVNLTPLGIACPLEYY